MTKNLGRPAEPVLGQTLDELELSALQDASAVGCTSTKSPTKKSNAFQNSEYQVWMLGK